MTNDWGVHDAYGIRPYEDAYGRPVLYPARSYSAYNVKAQQFRQANDGVEHGYGHGYDHGERYRDYYGHHETHP